RDQAGQGPRSALLVGASRRRRLRVPFLLAGEEPRGQARGPVHAPRLPPPADRDRADRALRRRCPRPRRGPPAGPRAPERHTDAHVRGDWIPPLLRDPSRPEDEGAVGTAIGAGYGAAGCDALRPRDRSTTSSCSGTAAA